MIPQRQAALSTGSWNRCKRRRMRVCDGKLEDAQARGANIIAEILGYRINSDGTDYVLPNPERQEECIRQALDNSGLNPSS